MIHLNSFLNGVCVQFSDQVKYLCGLKVKSNIFVDVTVTNNCLKYRGFWVEAHTEGV